MIEQGQGDNERPDDLIHQKLSDEYKLVIEFPTH
jgi:hypothetical protein